ncbi:MAG: type II toxin-antitoxin system RelE/ParE family toxin [Chloroflexi bacterium]|nr:type II toxin-antitoxin system RelE/ParE family toxin [Chloroflexota bacterium]
MNIAFADRDLEACAREMRRAVRRWGTDVGSRYPQRLVVLAAAPDFSALYKLQFLRLHKLSGEYEGKYAIMLHGRWRIILSRLSEQEVLIEEVTHHYGDQGCHPIPH